MPPRALFSGRHTNIVAASAPVRRGSARPAASRNLAAATEINTVAPKGPQGGTAGPGGRRRDLDPDRRSQERRKWMRIMLLGTEREHVDVGDDAGDADLTQMRAFSSSRRPRSR